MGWNVVRNPSFVFTKKLSFRRSSFRIYSEEKNG